MKKNIFYLVLSLTLLLPLGFSCEKNPENGDLDGQWQLMELRAKTDLSKPDYDSIVNKKDERIYWSFQLNLLMIRYIGVPGMNDFIARFDYGHDKLNIAPTYVHYRERDSLLEDSSTRILEPVGISGNGEKFQIKKLNSKSMILSNSVKQLSFRKF